MTTGINAFDRVVINPRERPLSSDINAAQARLDQTIREVMRGLHIPHSSADPFTSGDSAFAPKTGFLGDGFFVRALGTSRNVTLNAGLGFLLGSGVSNFGSISGVDDLNTYFPVYLPASLTIAIDAAPSSGQERFDIIEVAQDRRLENPLSRDVLDTGTGVFTAGSVNKTFAYVLDSGRYGRVVSPAASTTGIGYKVGVAATAGTATIPSATAGYTIVAIIKSLGGSTNVAQSDVRDERTLLFRDGVSSFGVQWDQTDGPPDVIEWLDFSLPAGMRMAARSLNLGVAASPVRFYFFGGKGVQVFPTVQVVDGGGAAPMPPLNFLVAHIKGPALSRLTTAEAALIAGQVEALADDYNRGQQYAYIDVAPCVVFGSNPTVKKWFITGSASAI